MDFNLPSTLDLPLVWVVETLAQDDQVDTSLLLDLLEKLPHISSDLARNAREAVFFRILEQFFVEGTLANPPSFASTEIIKLDPSDSCEDVLLRIVALASSPCLKLADLEMGKWDLQPFIRHKRSSLPKNTLQQLKDAILTGNNTFHASLIEQIGLHVGNQHEVIMNGGKFNGITTTLEGSTTGDPLVHEVLPSGNLPSVNRKRMANGENTPGASCVNQIIAKNGYGKKHKHDVACSEEILDCKLISSFAEEQLAEASAEQDKGKSCNIGVVNSVGNMAINASPKDDNGECISTKELIDCDEALRPEKECVHKYDLKEVEGDEEGFCETRSNEEIETNIKRNNLNAVEETHVEATAQNGSASDHNNDCTLEGLHGHHKVLSHEEQAPSCDVEKMQNHKPDLDKLEQNVPENVPNVAETKGGNILHDGGGFLVGKTSIDAKKKTFLSSQTTYSQDFFATNDWGELNLCIKCSKGGKLLFCSSDSCPLVIHMSCLGTDASYDTSGSFYCPFCEYSQAISKYMESKKKAFSARKNLKAFCSGTQKELKRQSNRSVRSKKTHQEPDDDLPSKNVKSHAEQTGPSDLQSGHNTPSRGKDTATAAIARVALELDKGKRKRETAAEASQSLIFPEEQQTDEPLTHKSLKDNTACQVSDKNDVREKHVGTRSKSETLCPPETDLSHKQKPSSSSKSVDSLVSSDEEYKGERSGVSKYFSRVRKPEKFRSHPAIPHTRRVVLPWTTAEENALKEGIKLYWKPGDTLIPWTRIFEHGSGIFNKSRTKVDLKDKWRNICKAALKS